MIFWPCCALHCWFWSAMLPGHLKVWKLSSWDKYLIFLRVWQPISSTWFRSTGAVLERLDDSCHQRLVWDVNCRVSVLLSCCYDKKCNASDLYEYLRRAERKLGFNWLKQRNIFLDRRQMQEESVRWMTSHLLQLFSKLQNLLDLFRVQTLL